MNTIRSSLGPFLLLSTAFHLLLVLSWYARYDRQTAMEEIPVMVIPAPEEGKLKSPQLPREAPARSAKDTAQLAKKSPPAAQEPEKSPWRLAEKDRIREPRLTPNPRREENEIIARQPLPTLKELLPPITWTSPEGRRNREGPIRLDSQEPRYVSYLTSVKQAIEIEWIYPDIALSHGLEGKLLLEFTILGNGQLEEARLLRSSGYSVLDEEAIRAIQAAAPFGPIPRSIGKSRLPIVATFEYHDNRLKYGFVP